MKLETRKKTIDLKEAKRFQKTVYDYYHESGRDLPWRFVENPYHVYVSEIMLQQTQVARVIEKYTIFINIYPTIETLASAPLSRIYEVWQGLGYNRRVISLKKTAQIIVEEYKGYFPSEVNELIKLPGIGHATASSISVFAFNQPASFIETNIRSVYLHHFFQERESVPDSDILFFVDLTLDRKNSRIWYYALMDYGVYLKSQFSNLNAKSRHYTKQSRFEGSDRQIRGKILRALSEKNKIFTATGVDQTVAENRLFQGVKIDKERGQEILTRLYKEGFLKYSNGRIVFN